MAFWPDVPRQPDQLRKLQIITCIELAAITVFAAAYECRVWRHNQEVQPDAQLYLQISSTAPNHILRYVATSAPLALAAGEIMDDGKDLTSRCRKHAANASSLLTHNCARGHLEKDLEG